MFSLIKQVKFNKTIIVVGLMKQFDKKKQNSKRRFQYETCKSF